MNQRARAPGAGLSLQSHSSSGGTQRPDGSRGRGNQNCKQWRAGLLRSSTIAEGEPPDADRRASRILSWTPRIPCAAQGRTPKPRAPGARPVGVCAWGALIALPQTTGPTETPDPELTQLAREKTPSTAPMVMRVTEVADAEAPSAVVTAG